jgi:hypothetical protein
MEVRDSGMPDEKLWSSLSNTIQIFETLEIPKPKGKVGILHWRTDIETLRGSYFSFRPSSLNILSWVNLKKFKISKMPFIIEPYHFGLVISKI